MILIFITYWYAVMELTLSCYCRDIEPIMACRKSGN